MCSAARPPLRSRWSRFAPASASSFTHGSEPSPATRRSVVRPSASTAVDITVVAGFDEVPQRGLIGLLRGSPPRGFVLGDDVWL
ncbi:hypothetical protein VIGAN_06159800 [Vigna angularis var. angularis]|uniref:Uncharacterized protein n=1 Tax=Vigna angularis var. angularis TaxID=157739 RepID=A0A0S3SC32_PHAAN|nr:hypothetical protein VIGAN_06159800 [Vigna angularis var. angularis]